MFHVAQSGLISTSSKDLDNFEIVRPKTVNEAVSYLNNFKTDPVAYAGGIDLVTAFRENKKIGTLVWLKDIDELKTISIIDNCLRVGALVTLAEGVDEKKLDQIPGFRKAWQKIANVRIRMQATIGGNIMARRVSYEMPILLTALKSRINFLNNDGHFNLPPEKILRTNKLNGALLTSIDIPLSNNPRIDYERSLRPLYTQALATFSEDSEIIERVVIATEFLRPHIFEIKKDVKDNVAVFNKLPLDYCDLRLSNNYIGSLVPIFYKRQLARIERNP